MLTSVGAFGPNLRPPSYHEIRVPLLTKELENTEILLKDHKEQWGRFGCSIMSDAWTDRKQRSHCIDLMLEDIGKLPLIKKTIQRAISLVGFIYRHSSTLRLLRFFTNKRELVRHAITRFATSFLTLERLHKEKGNLRKIFVSDDWTKNKLSKEAKGKEATKTVLMPAFWNNVLYILKVMAPLVKVLHLVDSEKKPAMGYIYEAMEKAKEAIMKSFENNESKYKQVFEITDSRWTCQLHRPLHAADHFLNPDLFFSNPSMEFDFEVVNRLYVCIEKLVPDQAVRQKILTELPIYKMGGTPWWQSCGLPTPNLQQLEIKILSLTCSASGCERNWSIFEQIHSKKRNKLQHKRLNNLVYAKYNQALVKRYNYRNEIDPISLNDIDECNEWLMGQMDGGYDDDDDAGNERVFEDENNDCLPWDRPSERSSSLREKEQMIEVEDNAVLEESEKELQGIDFGDSKEVERHAPLQDNEDYDYIGEGAEQNE
ncbi:hypothetical protein HKD37_20G055753 [Glycine soja]